MKMHLSILAAVACLTFSLTSHASDVTFTITGGTFSPTGTFSGTFLIDSGSELIDGGSITASDGVNTYTFFNAGNDSTIPGLATFTDANKDTFQLAVDGSLATLAVNTFANFGLADTDLITAAKVRYDATGGSLAPVVAGAAPEPSSLILLGTGALGLAGSLRRRFLNA